MLNDKIHFNLEELDSDKFKKIDSNISAGGSNKPINTIVWYFNLLKVKINLIRMLYVYQLF